jgi:hypothetical protein
MRKVISYVEAANAFCAWLCPSGRALDNPFASIRRVRTEEKLPHGGLSERDMARLLDELMRGTRIRTCGSVRRLWPTLGCITAEPFAGGEVLGHCIADRLNDENDYRIIDSVEGRIPRLSYNQFPCRTNDTSGLCRLFHCERRETRY